MKCRNNSVFPFVRRCDSKSSSGFSLASVLVGVGILGISAVVVSQTVINSRRAQKLVDTKLSSNKFQQAILDSLTERVKEFAQFNCSGATWGGTGTTEVEKAFSKIGIVADGKVGLQLNFTKSASRLPDNTDVKTRCQNPVGPATLNTGQYMRFCMEIKPTTATNNSVKYGFSQMDYRLLEVLIIPVNLATDKPITCAQARGAAGGMKVVWQIFNVLNNSRINSADTSNKTVTRESGVFLVSAETESYANTCNVTASRVGSTNQCKVIASGLGLWPPTLFNNGTPVASVPWTRDASVEDKFSATTPCALPTSSTFKVQSAAGSDFCSANVVPAQCTITANVGIWGSLSGGSGALDYSYPDMIKLPTDASNIQVKATSGDVDDSDMQIIVNGSLFHSHPGGGGGGFRIDKVIPNLLGGNNSVRLKGNNGPTFFSNHFGISGSYTASSCTHKIKSCWQQGTPGNCRWLINNGVGWTNSYGADNPPP